MSRREDFTQVDFESMPYSEVTPATGVAVDVGPTMVDDDVAPAGRAPAFSGSPTHDNSFSVSGETEVLDVFEQSDKSQLEPVVGWLVCIKGPCKGKDFRLCSGWNTIGRGNQADIDIPDPKISRASFRVSYDPRSCTYAVITCNEARNMVYLNDQPLYTVMKLEPYNVISSGNTDLMFVPMCGEKFVWED